MDEEREVLKSIYCLPGECCIDGNEVKVLLHVNRDFNNSEERKKSGVTKIDVQVVLHITNNYPEELPVISMISDKIHRNILVEVKKDVHKQVEPYIGSPLICEILNAMQEQLEERKEVVFQALDSCTLAENGNQNNLDENLMWMALLHLDHMKSKNRYVKTIMKWTEDLNLTGRLIFLNRLILIVLQGYHDDIKEYVNRQRSGNVDVDSRGQGCKERMLSVLSEQKMLDPNTRFQDFSVIDFYSAKELEDFFTHWNMRDLYTSHVKHIHGIFL
ncbi:hypothetical protein CHS0354_015426 [Potamilus streckersoni]|uniref:RWD domain-containing protein 3 n=1 Tax=Potamilus streckersoni TaxID=2493646 RepID=A0AAE0VNI5_9BIVA|nr:hypothetical protein CHS0354_015426 [Potamilus streckersoni]